jgi:hypothetical protein
VCRRRQSLRGSLSALGGAAFYLAGTMAAAWVAVMTIVATGMLPAFARIWRGPVTDPSLVRMTYDMEILATYAASSRAAFVSIAAPSMVIWRSRSCPAGSPFSALPRSR